MYDERACTKTLLIKVSHPIPSSNMDSSISHTSASMKTVTINSISPTADEVTTDSVRLECLSLIRNGSALQLHDGSTLHLDGMRKKSVCIKVVAGHQKYGLHHKCNLSILVLTALAAQGELCCHMSTVLQLVMHCYEQ